MKVDASDRLHTQNRLPCMVRMCSIALDVFRLVATSKKASILSSGSAAITGIMLGGQLQGLVQVDTHPPRSASRLTVVKAIEPATVRLGEASSKLLVRRWNASTVQADGGGDASLVEEAS